jgi:hypothetical protein
MLALAGWPIAVDGKIGPVTREAVSDFQEGFTFIELDVDGKPGPKTHAALVDCVYNSEGRRPGMCSEFFAFKEFKSKGNGWIKVHPRLLNRLDAYRRIVGPVHINSGYRDPAHNRAVGGASSSQHCYGTAADIPGVLGSDEMTEIGFSGLGRSGAVIIHVDVRAEGPNNTTGASVGSPTIWDY